jgi:hypothetical protein
VDNTIVVYFLVEWRSRFTPLKYIHKQLPGLPHNGLQQQPTFPKPGSNPSVGLILIAENICQRKTFKVVIYYISQLLLYIQRTTKTKWYSQL